MEFIFQQLRDFPFLTLFLALGSGYFIGKFTVGKFTLGGIAGTLIMAVIIGQVGGIHISESVQEIFFAIFIFMIGYLGGPQFFSSLKPSSLKYLGATFAMTVLGLLTVLGLSMWVDLDKGLAAGMAAGSLTQSAIIGTADNAIDQLGLIAEETNRLKTNVAVGYSITYIFGTIANILMVSLIAIVMKWDIRKEAIKLAAKMSGSKQHKDGEFEPLNRISTRVYKIIASSKFVDISVSELENTFNNKVTVELITREDESIEPDSNTILKQNDIIYITGLNKELILINNSFGEEIAINKSKIDFTEEVRKIILINKKFADKTLEQVKSILSIEDKHGIYINEIKRMSNILPILDKTELQKGDELSFIGRKKDLDRIEKEIGYKSPSLDATSFITFSLGMVMGYIIGEINYTINGTQFFLGTGVGCLISGLFVGYLQAHHPKLGGINYGAADFLRTFGLAIFVGIVGLNAGAPALEAIKEHGITLLFLGMGVSLIPMFIQFPINYYLYKINNPIEALGVMVGSRSSTAAMSTLLEKSGNSTSTPYFTMTYAVSIIFLTLWGPIIINLLK